MTTLISPATDDLLPRDQAQQLGVLADSRDRFDLMRAIMRCDEIVSQLRAIQIVHSQNLCRVANHLAADLSVRCEHPNCTDPTDAHISHGDH